LKSKGEEEKDRQPPVFLISGGKAGMVSVAIKNLPTYLKRLQDSLYETGGKR
jgi:hypothetical protein